MKNTTTKNNPMLPLNLTRGGFDVSNPEDEKIDVESLTEIRQFIRANFAKIKTCSTINNKDSISLCFSIKKALFFKEFKEGDFIAAMILEDFAFKKIKEKIYFNISEFSIDKLCSNTHESYMRNIFYERHGKSKKLPRRFFNLTKEEIENLSSQSKEIEARGLNQSIT